MSCAALGQALSALWFLCNIFFLGQQALCVLSHIRQSFLRLVLGLGGTKMEPPRDRAALPWPGQTGCFSVTTTLPCVSVALCSKPGAKDTC